MNNNELAALNFFIGKGLTRAQAAGIVGNIKQESGGDPNAPGGGLFQGQGGRTSSGSLSEQLNSVWRELSGTYIGALHALQKTNTPGAAARAFSEDFEKPGRPEIAKREAYAQEAFSGQAAGFPGSQIFTYPLEGYEKAQETLEAPLKAGEAATKFVNTILNPQTWLRIAEGLGGIVLIYMGLSALSRTGKAPTLIGTTRQAASGPRKVAEAAITAAAIK